jgi:hypothetical protein
MMRAGRALTRKALLPAPHAGRSGLSGTFRKFSESLFGKNKPTLPVPHTVNLFSR